MKSLTKIFLLLAAMLAIYSLAFGQEPVVPKATLEESAPRQVKQPSRARRFGRFLAAPFRDRNLMLAMLAQGGAMAFDGYTTSHVRRVCRGCREQSPLLGTRPSDGRIAATLGAGWYLQALLVKWEKDSSLRFAEESKSAGGKVFWNSIWLTHPTALTVGHTLAGLHNERVARCPSGFLRMDGVCLAQ